MTPPAFPKHLRVERADVGTRTARAFDQLRGLPVALKWATSRMQAQGLAREWRYLLRLSDRFVPAPVEFSRSGEREAYLTAAWVDAVPFDAFLRGATAEDQVAVVLDALAGLDHLHSAGLCHRDIRSRNALVVKGPAGPRVRWLDLEHAVTEGMLEAGVSYVAGRPAGEDRGSAAFNPQDDVRTFCELLGQILESAADHDAVRVLREFAARAGSVFYLDEMPHARAAWTILREAVTEAGLSVSPDCSALGVARWVPRSDAMRAWQALVGTVEQSAGAVLVVHGPPGLGKRTFLAHAAGELAAEGAHVANLLHVAEPNLQMLDAGAAAERKRVALLDTGSNVHDELRRKLIGAGWLIVVADDSERAAGAESWRAAGAPVSVWTFPAFGARDWYRWIAASV